MRLGVPNECDRARSHRVRAFTGWRTRNAAEVENDALVTRAATVRVMAPYRYTQYFDKVVLRKRPYISREWCIYVIEHALRVERQEDNRYRFWAEVPDLDGRFLRVVTLEDQSTIHNAFLDRGFKP